jgi:hypothetical protein
MPARRILAAAALVVLMLAGCGAPGFGDGGGGDLKPGRGKMVVDVRTVNGVPIPEFTYVRIEGPLQVIVMQRIGEEDVSRNLKAGKYQVVSWQQSCEDCPVNYRCGQNLVVPEQQVLRVVVVVDAGSCQLTTR